MGNVYKMDIREMENVHVLQIFYFIIKMMIDFSVGKCRDIRQHSKNLIMYRVFECCLFI
jgi:hypothetical protein